MLLEERKALPRGDWLYQIKYDGYRMLASTEPVALKTRNGADATRWFPEIVSSLARLPPGAHILDGEVCILDAVGRSDFDALHARARKRAWVPGGTPAVYCVFDLLVLNGLDLRDHPIEERLEQLRHLLQDVPGLLYVDSELDGAWLYAAALESKLEGVVAKRSGSFYVAGRSADWLKIKRPGAIPPGRFHRAI